MTKSNEEQLWSKCKVGDIIVGYHKGYWRLKKIDDRQGITPLFHYDKVANEKFKKSTGSKCCDAFYCRKVDKAYIESQKKEMEAHISLLEAFYGEHVKPQ